MKKYFIYAASALALASCASDEYLGEVKDPMAAAENGAIKFTGFKPSMTRAGANKTGAEAGNLLQNFYVLGTKGTEQTTSPTAGIVFDNYKVTWGANTAGTTEDNTDDWKYVGITPTGLHAGTSAPTEQSIKYWDFSTDQYDFIAYSVGANALATSGDPSANTVVGSPIKTPTTSVPASFTLKVASVDDLKECYFTDVTEVANSEYGQPVQLKFKSLGAKVRVAFYETIPGYSVSNLEFFQDASTARNVSISSNTSATLFSANQDIPGSGTITVSYPKVGTTAQDASDPAYNKAVASIVAGSTTASTQAFGTVNYTNGKLATASSSASMAGTAEDRYYTSVFPVSTPHALTLRVNYTLTSTDGSGETIKVYGAQAVVPSQYCTWQPNYAYTYIFKISDNTNGWTAATGNDNKEGLFPITFDAVVAAVDAVDFNQETITTVATPSVTTYAFNSSTNKVIAAYGVGNEYPKDNTTDIYVSVQNQPDLTNGVLYNITKGATPAKYDATEAEVIDALQMGTGTTTITGRNGVILTQENTQPTLLTASDKIPTEDGKGIEVTAKSVAKFTATGTATTYAYVYKVSDGTASYIYTAETVTDGTNIPADTYYDDHIGSNAIAAGTVSGDHVYYKKITNNNNTYAVKVIKTY